MHQLYTATDPTYLYAYDDDLIGEMAQSGFDDEGIAWYSPINTGTFELRSHSVDPAVHSSGIKLQQVRFVDNSDPGELADANLYNAKPGGDNVSEAIAGKDLQEAGWSKPDLSQDLIHNNNQSGEIARTPPSVAAARHAYTSRTPLHANHALQQRRLSCQFLCPRE